MKEEVRKNVKDTDIKIPEGVFCGGNCSDCVYYELHNRRSDGRCWCNKMNSWYYPSERNGCFYYREY